MSSLRRRAIWVHAREVDRAQLDRRPRERAHDRAGVAGVDEQAQPGEHVADLGALEERRGADQPVRARRAPRARRRPPGPRGARSARARDVLGRDVLARDQALDVGRDGLRLRALVGAAPERDLAGAGSRGRSAWRCGRARARRPPRAARGRARRSGATRSRRTSSPAGSRCEVREVLRRGAAEAVDRLVVVAGGGEVAVVGASSRAAGLGELGSWTSSTSTWRKRAPARARTCGFSRAARAPQHEVARGRARRPRRACGRARRRASANSRSRSRPVVSPASVAAHARASAVDQLVLEPVDALDDRASSAPGCREVVQAQRQLVDVLEQHRQPVGGETGMANGSSPPPAPRRAAAARRSRGRW